MNKIIYPLSVEMQSPEVSDLQEALLFLLEKDVFGIPDEERDELTEQVKLEREQGLYGEATARVVVSLRAELGLDDKDDIDEETADVINSLLESYGAFNVEAPEEPLYAISGTVRDVSGKPWPDVTVWVEVRELGARFKRLGDNTKSGADGGYVVPYAPQALRRGLEGIITVRVTALSSDGIEQASEQTFKPGSGEPIDVIFHAEPALNEWETLNHSIRPLLDEYGISEPADLTDGDIKVLAQETGLDMEHIRLWVVAFRMAMTHRLLGEDEQAYIQEHQALYAGLRKGMPEEWDLFVRQRIMDVRQTLYEAIDQNIVPPSLREVIEIMLDNLPNPDWQTLRRTAIGALSPEKAQVVVQAIDHLDAIDDQVLSSLVQSDTLDDAEANRLGLYASLYRLDSSSTRLIDSMPSLLFESLDGRSPQRASDLAKLNIDEWVMALKEARIDPLPEQSIESLAETMSERIAGAFPSIALIHRISRLPSDFDQQMERLQPTNSMLPELWNQPLGENFSEDTLNQLTDEQREAFDSVLGFALSHPALPINRLTLAELNEAAVQLVSDLQMVRQLNNDIDLLQLDYTLSSADVEKLNFGTLPEERQRMVLQEYRAHQRVAAIAPHPTATQAVMRAGFHSSMQIALVSSSDFYTRTRLSEAEARSYYRNARTRAQDVSVRYFAIRDAAQDVHLISGIGKSPSSSQFSDQLQSWAKLFGRLDYCDCEHCLSVFSPAAYFVDLMHYVEEHILKPSFNGNEGNKYHLQYRREDLWKKLDLTCSNTNEYVPTLEIVNEILETWITNSESGMDSDTIYTRIAESDDIPSFRLPVVFPLERLEILLSHFGLSRDRVAQALDLDLDTRVRTRLKLSLREKNQIAPNQANRNLMNDLDYYERLFRRTEAGGILQINIDVILSFFSLGFLQQITELDINVLRELLLSKFVNQDGSNNNPIEVKLRANTDDIQNSIEAVCNLSLNRLDRLARLIRLWRKLPWTVGELDYVLMHCSAYRKQTVPELDDAMLQDIVQILDLMDYTTLPVDEVMALWLELPTDVLRGNTSLFHRRFNTQPYLTRDGSYPDNLPIQFTHPANATGVSVPDQSILSRLLVGLGLDDRQFVELIDGLRDITVDEPIGGGSATEAYPLIRTDEIRISRWMLNVLYRCARLARFLKVGPGELNRLIHLTPKIIERATTVSILDKTQLYCTTASEVLEVIRLHKWIKSSGYSIDEIEWLLDSAKVPESVSRPEDIASRIIQRMTDENLAIFPSRIFTQIGMTEQQSRNLVTSLTMLIEPSGAEDSYRLKLDVNDTTLQTSIPETIEFNIAETAILGVANEDGQFSEDNLISLFLDQTTAHKLITDNLETTAEPLGAFVEVQPATTNNPAIYAFNSALNRNVLGSDDAQQIVMGFLKSLHAANLITSFDDTVFTAIHLSEQQSRWLFAANLGQTASEKKAFIPSPDGRAFLLNDVFFAPPVGKPVVEKIVTGQVSALLQRYAWNSVLNYLLGAEFSVTPETVNALRKFLPELSANDLETLENELVGYLRESTELQKLVREIQRLHCLFKAKIFDVAALNTVHDEWERFNGGDNFKITLDTLRAITSYALWLKPPITIPVDETNPKYRAHRDALVRIIAANSAANEADLAVVLDCPPARIQSAAGIRSIITGDWYEQLQRWKTVLEIMDRLGLSGETLSRMYELPTSTTENLTDIMRCADDVYGAICSKYSDEKTRKEKTEAFEDLIRGKQRDALVAYITTQPDTALNTPARLSGYFLIDVEAEGCARTSRLVAAISSLQLYVHRVRMRLEAFKDPHGRTHRVAYGTGLEDIEAYNQWAWRKNYRVWEANRKVFLFPENYIEPDLRDDKTPLFQELESQLLQRQITTATAEESYSRYLEGYDVLAGLKIVGAFHDVVHNKQGEIVSDVLHLIGATADDPPQHYHRQIYNLKLSQEYRTKPVHFSFWEKLTTQIPVKWVSPVVFQRKLMLFWIEITTTSTTRRSSSERAKSTYFFDDKGAKHYDREIDNSSYFDGYSHRFKVKFVQQSTSGAWSAPQELTFTDDNDQPIRAFKDTVIIRPTPGYSLSLEQALPWFQENEPSGLAQLITKGWNSTNKVWDELPFVPVPFKAVPFTIFDPSASYDSLVHHGGPKDSFTVSGWRWDRIYPTVRQLESRAEELQLIAMDLAHASLNMQFHGFVDLSRRKVPMIALGRFTKGYKDANGDYGGDIPAPFVHKSFAANGQSLIIANWSNQPFFDVTFAMQSQFFRPTSTLQNVAATFSHTLDGFVVNQRTPVSLGPVNPIAPAAIIEHGVTQSLFWWVCDASVLRYLRLTTSTARPLTQQLGAGGLPGLLNYTFQKSLKEEPHGISNAPILEGLPTDSTNLDFKGAFGTYLSEIFFHTPFLIANYQNTQQHFEAAQRWYHYIFDPSSPSSSPWQYREFVDAQKDVKKMREILKDPVALDAYRNDPFSPYTIARLRLSAFEKAIVMKYIDNLLDWGDKLFNQFTMEAVNEAMMLYVLAAEILGERPNNLGKCIEEKPRTYEDIRPFLNETSDFLIEELELEAIAAGTISNANIPQRVLILPGLDNKADNIIMSTASALSIGTETDTDVGLGIPSMPQAVQDRRPQYWSGSDGTPLSEVYNGNSASIDSTFTTVGPDSNRLIGGYTDDNQGGFGGTEPLFSDKFDFQPGDDLLPSRIDEVDVEIKYTLHDAPPQYRDVFDRFPPPAINPVELVTAHNVFCFPVNKELLAYWDRVEDRLFKIRNCMDIAGVRRRLELFAPEIDPTQLVRMKAAGLSLEDILDVTTGHAPPYRFVYLLEKARQYAATVQSLGAQLLFALEKRDAEELTVLRTVHERHLLDMRSKLMQWEVNAAKDTLASLNKQRDTAEFRHQHYQSLLNRGLSEWEIAQSDATYAAKNLSSVAALLDIVSGIATFIPEMQAPTLPAGTAAETGGKTAALAIERFSSAVKSTVSFVDIVGRLAGMEASLQRRGEEWQHQSELAKREVSQINHQIDAAELRQQIAERSLEVHQKSIEQANEVYEFYRDKFTSHGLYTWVSGQIQRLHRMSFHTAWAMARMAERALHFERPDLEKTVTLSATPWDASRNGLLAGESLLLDLQRMEMAYLETNYRMLEVRQSFSLSQIAPTALSNLRQNGECDFSIPELFLNLSYPGQYLQRIKSVRLTVPCVVGPYTSVSAVLTLTDSNMRTRPDANSDLKSVPVRYAPSIATSTAQNDAGVFEFNLRDEKLMPFEGCGAISSWNLKLPKKVKAFDYSTISDVVLHIDYTALYDEVYSKEVQETQGFLLEQLTSTALTRLFSVRHEFPTIWAKFKSSSSTNSLEIELRKTHFPFWVQSMILTASSVAWHAQIRSKDSGQLTFSEQAETTLSSNSLSSSDDEMTISLQLSNKEMVDDIWLTVNYNVSEKINT